VLGVCGDKLSTDGGNFLLLLVENGRLGVLPEIRDLFEELRREHEGVLEVEVTSAFPMDEAQLAQLRQKLQAKYGRQVQASVSVEPELIGGVRVKIGDEVLDASVRGKLQGMASALAR
jgi:F-type H+-transporting ATPase subunit delta